MPAPEQLTQAIIDGTMEIFASLEMGLEHAPPREVVSGSVHGQVTSLLTYRETISGSFVFKCSIDFASVLCMKMVGMDGRDDDYALLKDAVAETLNWISGGIKRHYEEGTKIIISTPMVYVMEDDFETAAGDEQVTCITFFYEEHEFTMEIMVNE